jgi:hypothetical protein
MASGCGRREPYCPLASSPRSAWRLPPIHRDTDTLRHLGGGSGREAWFLVFARQGQRSEAPGNARMIKRRRGISRDRTFSTLAETRTRFLLPVNRDEVRPVDCRVAEDHCRLWSRETHGDRRPPQVRIRDGTRTRQRPRRLDVGREHGAVAALRSRSNIRQWAVWQLSVEGGPEGPRWGLLIRRRS